MCVSSYKEIPGEQKMGAARVGWKGGGCSPFRSYKTIGKKSRAEVCLPIVDLSEVTAEKNL